MVLDMENKPFEELLEIPIFKELMDNVYNAAMVMETYNDPALVMYKDMLTENISVWNIVKYQSWRRAAKSLHSPLHKEALRGVVKCLDQFKIKMDDYSMTIQMFKEMK